MESQLRSFIERYLFRYMCGYRKGDNAQYALMTLLEKWKKSVDNHGYAGTILMDLSKAFDIIDYELLVAKLHAYGLTKPALKLVLCYLKTRCHRTKINSSFSTWKALLMGVPQGSILGLLLFNIYLNDLFFTLDQTNSCIYTDDTGIYACDQDLPKLLCTLEHDTSLAIE